MRISPPSLTQAHCGGCLRARCRPRGHVTTTRCGGPDRSQGGPAEITGTDRAALGVGGCTDCHSATSAFFWRQTLVDPFDDQGRAVTVPQYVALEYAEDWVHEHELPGP